jgi:hypothetical protein
MPHAPLWRCSDGASAGPVVQRLPLLHELLLQPPQAQQDAEDVCILLQLLVVQQQADRPGDFITQ